MGVENKIIKEDENKIDKGANPSEKTEDEWDKVLGTNGIMKKILQKGQPNTRPQRLQVCTINYQCKLENGILVEKYNNLDVQLGDCDVN